MSPATDILEPATRLRSATALARAVVRDLAEQDSGPGEGLTAVQQIKAWRRDATNSGDSTIVNALDLLGDREAARVYALGPRRGNLTNVEREKLYRAAKKARA